MPTKPTPLTDHELDQLYRDFLDEAYEPVSICGLTYQASDAFESVDPTAYRCGFSDWLDSESRDGSLVESDGEYYLKSDIDDYELQLEDSNEDE